MKKFNFTTLIFPIIFSFSVTLFSQETSFKNEGIKSMIDKKRAFNKATAFGFRIQLYNGKEGRAKRIKTSFENEFPKIFTKLKYEEPDWKVQVGNYQTKLEAERALLIFSEKFSGAFVLKK